MNDPQKTFVESAVEAACRSISREVIDPVLNKLRQKYPEAELRYVMGIWDLEGLPTDICQDEDDPACDPDAKAVLDLVYDVASYLREFVYYAP